MKRTLIVMLLAACSLFAALTLVNTNFRKHTLTADGVPPPPWPSGSLLADGVPPPPWPQTTGNVLANTVVA